MDGWMDRMGWSLLILTVYLRHKEGECATTEG